MVRVHIYVPKDVWSKRYEQINSFEKHLAAHEDVLNKTNADYAPWYVVPANRKWYRDLVISTVLVDA